MNRSTRRTALFCALLVLFIECLTVPTQACTTFCFQDQGGWIYGRNFEWSTGNCRIMVNKRGIAKGAYGTDNPAQWVSQYGSITFNQHGREFPLGGMNETGLVIECMWLKETAYPVADTRNALSELQWVQYLLDNFSTIEEVLACDKKIRISSDSSPLHFFICDTNGHATVVEFLEGKMKSYTGDTLPYSALANATYDQSLKFMKMVQGKNEAEFLKRVSESHNRFAKAAVGVSLWPKNKNTPAVTYAFKILTDVTVDHTMFSIVYDTKNKHIYFRTKEDRSIRFVNFAAFDFTCRTPVQILNIQAKGNENNGNVTNDFCNYSTNENYALIKQTYQETPFLKNKPEATIQKIAQYPDTLRCQK